MWRPLARGPARYNADVPVPELLRGRSIHPLIT